MKKILFVIAVIMVTFVQQSAAQDVSRAKAMLTLNFIRYLGWSDEAREGDFVIGVIKERELSQWLKKLSAGKKLGFQDIVVKEFKNVDEMEDCQVIFVSQSSNYSKISDAVQQKVGKNTLIVTEVDGATSKGAMINFVVRDDKLMFELHKKNAAIGGIQFSQKLESLAGAINL